MDYASKTESHSSDAYRKKIKRLKTSVLVAEVPSFKIYWWGCVCTCACAVDVGGYVCLCAWVHVGVVPHVLTLLAGVGKYLRQHRVHVFWAGNILEKH